MIQNMEKVSSIGNQGMFIKAISLVTKEKGMVRCTGKMEVPTKGSGAKVSNTAKVPSFYHPTKHTKGYSKTMS